MKRFFALLLSWALLLSLCGCHGSREQEGFALPQEFDTSRNYEITFWAKNDTNLTQVEIYKQAITAFQDLYPNITVNLRLYTDYGRIYNDVITNISTGTTPNVCVTYPDHIATYLTGESTVVPLDTLLTHKKYGLGGSDVAFDSPRSQEIVEKFLDECAFSGHYYALPFMRSTECCYVNKTLVEKLGYTLPETLTWDFVWEVSEAALAQDGEGTYLLNGQKVMIPFLYKSTDNMMIQMLRQLDAGYTTDAGEILLFSDTTQALLETVADHARSGAFSTFKVSSYPANFLNAGQCIFAIDSTAGATWMGSSAPLLDISEDQIVEFETAVMPIPQFDTENPTMISQGPSLCLFNKEDPQEVLASWLFMQFLLTDEIQIAYSQTEGYAPVTTKAQESAAYQDYLSRSGEDNDLHYCVKLQATQLLLNNTENTFVTPVFNGSAAVRNAAGQLIENTVKGVRRNKTIDSEFFADLFVEMTTLYHLDQAMVETSLAETPLPTESKVLLWGLTLCWTGMGLYWATQQIKRKKSTSAH